MYNIVFYYLIIFITDMNAYAYQKICTKMLIAGLFIIAKNWKQSKCPIAVE